MRHSYALLFLLTALLTPLMGWAQSSVGIGTTSPDPKAALDISATGKGLLIPRMDSATRAGITAPPDGLMVFQTDGRKGFWYAVGGAWVYIPDKTKSGDNLGSHTATQNLNLNGNKLTGGGTSGLEVSSAGTLTVDALTGSGSRLVTTNDAGELNGSSVQNGLMLDGDAVKLGGTLTDTTTLLDAPMGGQVVQLRTTDGQTSVVAGPAYLPSSSNGGTSLLGWLWQPFEATTNGVLNAMRVRIFVNTAGGSITGTLFAGAGISGTPLSSTSVAISSTGLQLVTLTWPTPPTVVAGQFYTLRLERNGNSSLSWLSSNVGVPSGWSNSNNTGAYLFNSTLTMSPVSHGVVLQNGQVTLDGLSGTGPRMVTAAADGTLTTQALPTDAQQLTIAGSTISLTNGGSVTVPSSADNLGNHTATQNINLNGNKLTGGGSQGLDVSSTGNVGIGAASTGAPLEVYVPVEVQDQSQGIANAYYAAQQPQTQTFTAGQSGALTSVAIGFFGTSGGPTSTTVSISAVSSGGCSTGPVLATATITPVVNSWVKAVFSNPITVVAGNSYAITLANGFNWAVSTLNPYAGGRSCNGSTIDYKFVTYVAVPSQMLSVTTDGVGIKTSTPQAELDVAGTLRATGLQMTTGGATGKVLTSDASGNATWQAVPSSADNLGNHTATQNLNLATNLLTGGGASGLRITSTGFVGIGTPAPNGLLHLVGNETTTNGFNASLRLQNTAATTANTWTLRAGGVGTAAPDGGFSIADNNNYRLSITNTGLVGVGTNAPAARFTVVGSDATTHGKNAAIMLQNTAATTANTWTMRAGALGTATPDGGFSIADDGSYRLTITSTGRVGIGTNTPAQTLDVAGNLRLQGQSGTTERLLVADAQGDVQPARYFSHTFTGVITTEVQPYIITHNLGYQPVWMLSIETGETYPSLTVSYENLSNTQTKIRVYNAGLFTQDATVHAIPVR